MTDTVTPLALRIKDVGKTYTGHRGTAVEALRGINLDVAEGEFVCLVGASGCGKSTLLRLVAGFEGITSGQLDARNGPVDGPGPDRGVVFQDYGLFPWLTVAANIAYGPRQRGLPSAEIAARTARYLTMVQLDSFADRYPSELSGGMQQRVAIARVLANDPAVLLMDEPFGALDSLTRERLQHSLTEIWQQVRPTVLFVTHSVEEALFLADRVIVMSGGPNHGVPGHIVHEERVTLARPRDVTAPEFNSIKRRLLDAIHAQLPDVALASVAPR
ncbi:ABC transporter ATP-binding protein [Verrucosispora sp. WMMC514]|uniref:ABC transporter ATP-binding protein n=1 Tax=Verrucosispora sp. WMMC514 TaxID=3015156 RepID=UPI00248BB150|nr:ABC transporter ATP-binding protein [Verrucosispora sp. WMMC514]WBB91263.1 ABC transporter ATP-binding protein [Verrucosispora sp. WMMC514]